MERIALERIFAVKDRIEVYSPDLKSLWYIVATAKATFKDYSAMLVNEPLNAPITVTSSNIADFRNKTGEFIFKKKRIVPLWVPETIEASASRPAPKKDQIHGSKKNAPGSASGGKKIVFSDKTETALKNKVKEHNEKAPAGRKASLGMLKAVYRRGAGAFSSSHRPGKTRDQWAMARVNAFLRLLRTGKPANANYKQDNDLLPQKHPRSTRGTSAGAAVDDYSSELTVSVLPEAEYESSEDAILAMAEYSGLGYEIIPALRTAWQRAVDSEESPFERTFNLVETLYSSKDSDLLPARKQA